MLAATSPWRERGRAPRFSSFPVFVSSVGLPGSCWVWVKRELCVCMCVCVPTLASPHGALFYMHLHPPPSAVLAEHPPDSPRESQAAQTNETPVGVRRRRGGSDTFVATVTVAFHKLRERILKAAAAWMEQ